MSRATLVFACALLCATGCKALLKKREPITTESSATAPQASAPVAVAPAPPPPAPPPVAPVVDDAVIPTTQDFEDEALEKVTPANFRAELARLKKEIEKK
ncbi:MAG TPA: hypothetical protein VFQ35_15605 [Polyangiaceae bacterium]|nr:hypothetical protein [Polyangiaceae bacterium]